MTNPADFEPMTAIRLRVPAPLRRALERARTEAGQSPSQFVRDVLFRDLAARGYWPPRAGRPTSGG